MTTSLLIAFGAAVVVGLLAFAGLALALRSPGQSLGEVIRVAPDSLRLVVALYRDRTLPGSVRWRLRVALLYNVQPINLIPDWIPVVGLADNIAVLAWALRSTVCTAGLEAVMRHWRGSPESLATLCRALRLPAPHLGPALPRTPSAAVCSAKES